jgi:hypothetical protein
MNFSFGSDDGDSLISTLLASPSPNQAGLKVCLLFRYALVFFMLCHVLSNLQHGTGETPIKRPRKLDELAKQRLVLQESELVTLRQKHTSVAQTTFAPGLCTSQTESARKRLRPRCSFTARAAESHESAKALLEADLSDANARYSAILNEKCVALAQRDAEIRNLRVALSTEKAAFHRAKGEWLSQRQSLEASLPSAAALSPRILASIVPPNDVRTHEGVHTSDGQGGILALRLQEQRASYDALLGDLQAQLLQAQKAQPSNSAQVSQGTLNPHTVAGSVDLRQAKAQAASLRKQLAAAERRNRRLQAAATERAGGSEGLLELRLEREALTAQVARLQVGQGSAAEVEAALQRGCAAVTASTERLLDMRGLQSAHVSVVSEQSTGAGERAARVWAALHSCVDGLVQEWLTVATSARESAQSTGSMRAKLVRCERQAAEDAARISALEAELVGSDTQRIADQCAAATAERRVASLTREVQSLEALLDTFSKGRAAVGDSSSPRTPTKQIRQREGDALSPLQLHAATSLAQARDEIAALQAAASSSMTPNAAVEKLRGQAAVVQDELGAVRQQLSACLAREERLLAETAALQHQVGRGDFNAGTTKVLHLKANPVADAASVSQRQAEAHLVEVEAELTRLRNAVTAAEVRGGGTAGEGGSVLNESTAFVPAAALEQAKTKCDRLMSVFKQKTKTFRDGLYEITGWKVNMEQKVTGEAVFRFSSLFAEREEDELRFALSAAGQVQMLESAYCPSRVDPKLLMLLQIGGGARLPAFFASLTLDLHGKQTLA